MRAVAKAAGVGKGTLFHRFGDRDGLLREAGVDGDHDMLAFVSFEMADYLHSECEVPTARLPAGWADLARRVARPGGE